MGIKKTIDFSIGKNVALSHADAVAVVTEELRKEGFGVLTTIDVQETLKKKLDVDVDQYVILGACNPAFAHGSLGIDPEIGLFLPCNVIVYRSQGQTHVAAFDPAVMSAIVDSDALRSIATEVRQRIERVIRALP